MPDRAWRWYAPELLDAIFDLAADIEETEHLVPRDRMILELSVWDVCAALSIDRFDRQRAEFIRRRRERLLGILKKNVFSALGRLCLKWAWLLRPQPMKVYALPGPYAADALDVVMELLSCALPRRAQALGLKFHLPQDPIVLWNIQNRPASEEVERLRQVLERLPAPRLPYQTLRAARSLRRILSAKPTAMPLHIDGSGCISIEGDTYGFTRRGY